MTDTSARNRPESYWNYLPRWTPTSPARGFRAEESLLGRYLHLLSKDNPPAMAHDPKKPWAMLDAVPITATGCSDNWINTLKLLHDDQATLENWRDSQRTLVDLAFGEQSERKNLVIAHGFGAGLGFFYKNYQALSMLKGYQTYAIDWLGMGNSSRPAFPKKHYRMTDQDIVDEAEDFFVESLEEWRSKMKLNTMVLVGHSLGGYLSTAYALKYPERVEKLILVSPVGVNEHPVEEELPPPDHKNGYAWNFLSSLWSWGVSPQNFIRGMLQRLTVGLGPVGPRLVKGYATRRFRHLEPDEIKVIEDYIFHISAQRGSGEYALSRLLVPKQKLRPVLDPTTGEQVMVVASNVYARHSLATRLPMLTMPTTFLYGDDDWMDHRHALKVAPRMKVPTKVAVVHGAGHHLYLDNPEGFNHALIAELNPMGQRDDVSYPFI
ncbi:hypothetical protein HDU91_001676 [Kappamyces sp. JEL0680]|nr:hypothetical protein HDU91_001676 [Kappamyces sp. JEL0680]